MRARGKRDSSARQENRILEGAAEDENVPEAQDDVSLSLQAAPGSGLVLPEPVPLATRGLPAAPKPLLAPLPSRGGSVSASPMRSRKASSPSALQQEDEPEGEPFEERKDTPDNNYVQHRHLVEQALQER